MAMACIAVSGGLVGLCELLAPTSPTAFVAAMLIMAPGIAIAVSIAPNGALTAAFGTLAVNAFTQPSAFPILLFSGVTSLFVMGMRDLLVTRRQA